MQGIRGKAFRGTGQDKHYLPDTNTQDKSNNTAPQARCHITWRQEKIYWRGKEKKILAAIVVLTLVVPTLPLGQHQTRKNETEKKIMILGPGDHRAQAFQVRRGPRSAEPATNSFQGYYFTASRKHRIICIIFDKDTHSQAAPIYPTFVQPRNLFFYCIERIQLFNSQS